MVNRIKEKKKIFEDKLKKVKGYDFKLIGSYSNMNTKTEFKHLSCGYEWETSPTLLINHKSGCPKCNNKIPITKSILQKKLNDKYPNTFEVKEEYKNAKVRMKFLHNRCGRVFYCTSDDLVRRGRCTICSTESRKRSKAKSIEKYKEEVFELVKNEFEVLSDYYFNWKTQITFKHTECGTVFSREANSFLQGRTTCPSCKGYKGELFLEDILNELGIKFTREKSFEDLVYKRKLRFDFHIIRDDKNILIEYQGAQHSEPVSYFGGETEFKKRLIRDTMKRDYCLKYNYILVEVPHTADTKEKVREIILPYLL